MSNLNMENKVNEIQIPKIFWKYYDLFRRRIISLEEFEQLSGLDKQKITEFLQEIEKETGGDFYDLMCYNGNG